MFACLGLTYYTYPGKVHERNHSNVYVLVTHQHGCSDVPILLLCSLLIIEVRDTILQLYAHAGKVHDVTTIMNNKIHRVNLCKGCITQPRARLKERRQELVEVCCK